MRSEAAHARFHDSVRWGTRHARLQLLTVEQLLSGQAIDMPPVGQVSVTFKKAPKTKDAAAEQLTFDD